MDHIVFRDAYHRTVFADVVLWHLAEYRRRYEYAVARFPFVPGYHVCEFVRYDHEDPMERPLQVFKTLAEALAVMRVLLAALPEPTDG